MNQFLKNLHAVTIFCISDFHFAAINDIRILRHRNHIHIGHIKVYSNLIPH